MSKAATHDDLDGTRAAAHGADPSQRIEFRDSIASFGENAVEAMTDWLGEPRLAAFAIRVLEAIGRDVVLRSSVADVLEAVDRDELPPHLVRDVDAALAVHACERANLAACASATS